MLTHSDLHDKKIAYLDAVVAGIITLFAIFRQVVSQDKSDSVIPGLTRNPTIESAGPVGCYWIPAPQGCFLRGAFAGMTWLSIVFFLTAY